jgi:hypothetical protein
VKVVELIDCPETMLQKDIDEEQEPLRLLKILQDDFFKDRFERKPDKTERAPVPDLDCIAFLFQLFNCSCDISSATITR